MKKIFSSIRWPFRAGSKKGRGQSIVEFALLLPLLLMMLSSLIEFGFILNEYLDLIDTTRETARFLADYDPFTGDDSFYTKGRDEMKVILDRAGWIKLNPASDDLIISVFSLTGDSAITRYPGSDGWRLHGNKASEFTSAEVLERISGKTTHVPPNNGLVLVEIYYDYHMKMGLPWVSGIVGDTVTLHAFSFAPNPAAEP